MSYFWRRSMSYETVFDTDWGFTILGAQIGIAERLRRTIVDFHAHVVNPLVNYGDSVASMGMRLAVEVTVGNPPPAPTYPTPASDLGDRDILHFEQRPGELFVGQNEEVTRLRFPRCPDVFHVDTPAQRKPAEEPIAVWLWWQWAFPSTTLYTTTTHTDIGYQYSVLMQSE